MGTENHSGSWERMATTVDVARLWVSKAWKIGVMMAKGAYLIGERRRLYLKLGEEAFSRLQTGAWKDPELESILKQLERVNKKVELEEMLIRGVRFGSRPGRHRSEGESDSPPAPSGDIEKKGPSEP